MQRPFTAVLIVLLIGLVANGADAPTPFAARQWLDTRLLRCEMQPPGSDAIPENPSPVGPGLDVYSNNDPVIPITDGSRPMKIGDRAFARGLYCHAVSKVVVRLPGAGRRFSALVGLDHNTDTARGKGSVVFSVIVANKTAFQSDVMRFGTPSREVDVDLGGARTFALEIGDAGDGIGWDQSNWADAKVILADGRELWLDELPLRDHRPEATASAPIPRSSDLLFSFEYGGRSSDDLLATWPKRTLSEKLDTVRTRHTVAWTDGRTGLEVRCVAVGYSDFPAVEWTVYFKNTGKQDAPILEAVQGLDARIERKGSGEFLLHHWRGDTCGRDLYAPLRRELPPRSSVRFTPAGGRGTNGQFPYYNLAMPGGGVLLAVGWPGQWATSFTRDTARSLRIIAGQELTRFKLKPGEVIRTPLIAMVFWAGTDLHHAHNLWRRWMWAHNVPRDGEGRLPPPMQFGCSSGIFNEMLGANEENQTLFIDRFLEEGIQLDYWWMDAGWYPCGGQWWNTGKWEPDLTRFPRGLRAISDHAQAKGVKTLVWFEPERVKAGWAHSAIRPEWVLGGQLLNLGNPDAWKWLVEHVDRTIRDQGIDLYRQDFNMDPLGCWRGNDDHDRVGITENLHVQGYLAYWDELRRRHPHLIIDSCASGGRRNDLETMRRAVPLHPTDYNYGDLAVKQAFHLSLLQWIPYFGSNNCGQPEAYACRSGYGMGFAIGPDMRQRQVDYSSLRKLTEQWRRVIPCWYGDYYPLTPYSADADTWIAWQFHLPEQGEGVVHAFRRDGSGTEAQALRLRGLDPDARYHVHDLDKNEPDTIRGRTLLETGLTISIPTQPGAVVIHYTIAR